jgi:hypothetical protein
MECERLDLEIEMAAFVAVENGLGVEGAEECEGCTWEHFPLGAFTSKNFASSISP